MSKLLVSAAIAAMTAATGAVAADLPRKAQPPVFLEVSGFNWTGAYAGVNLGYGRSDDLVRTSSAQSSDPTTASLISALKLNRVRSRADGILAGGQVGYNYQFTPGSGIVVGIEADAQYADLSKRRRSAFAYSQPSAQLTGVTFADTATSNSLDALGFLGTVRGRIGYGFDRVLVYGTGGLAYGDVKTRANAAETFTWTNNATGVSAGLVDVYTTKSSHLQTGYAFGGGIEYAIPTDSILNFFRASAVTLKAEYLHYDLGSCSIGGHVKTISSFTYTAPATVTKVRNEGDTFRAGLNYKFGVF